MGQLSTSAFQAYDPTQAANIVPGPLALYTVNVDSITPTQVNEGFAEVARKTAAFDLETPAQLQASLITDIEPVVIGPGGVLYLTDGHHTFTALEDSIYGVSNPTVYVNVIENYSNLSTAAFFAQMQANNFLLPLNNGVAQTVNTATGAPIPTTLTALTNDPYRGLEYSILKNKNSKLFSTTSNITGTVGSSIPGLDKMTGFYSDFLEAAAYRSADGGLGLPYLSPGDVAVSSLWNLTGTSTFTLPNVVGSVTAAQLPGFILSQNLVQGGTIAPTVISNATLAGGALDGNGTFTGITTINAGTAANPIIIGTPNTGFILQLGADKGFTVTLNGANTYTGGTSILAGTLIVTSDAALGAAATGAAINTTNLKTSIQAANGIVFNSLTEGNGTLQIGTASGAGTSSFTTNRAIAVGGEAATINLNGYLASLTGQLYSLGTASVGIGNAAGLSDLTIDDNASNKGVLTLATASPNFYGNIIVGNVNKPTVRVMNDAALGATTGNANAIGQIELNGGVLQAGASFSASERNIFLAGGSTIDVAGFTTTWGTLSDTQRVLTITNSSATAGAATFASFNIASSASLVLSGTGSETVTFTNGIARAGTASLILQSTALGTTDKVLSGTGAASVVDGIAPAWLVTNGGTASSAGPYDFVTYGTNGYVTATYGTTALASTTGATAVKLAAASTTAGALAAYALNTNGKAITVASGSTLTIGDGTAADAAGLILAAGSTISGGTLAFGGSEGMVWLSGTTAAIGSTITGTDGLTFSGSGAVTLNAAETVSGPITINSGTVTLGATGVFASDAAGILLQDTKSTPAKATLAVTANNTVTTLNSAGNNSAVTIAAGATLTIGDTVNNLSSTISSTITGTTTGNIVKAGSGLLDLSAGKVTLGTGGTFSVTGGALRVAVGTSSSVGYILSNGADLQFAQNGGGQYSGAISGAGTLHLIGGTLQLTGTANSYTGGTILETGSTLDVTTANLSTSNENIRDSGGLVVFDQTTAGTFTGVISDGAELGTGPVLSGALDKDDSSGGNGGNVTLTAVQTYTGATTIEAGTLTLGLANAIATSSGVTLGRVGGGATATLALAANESVANLASNASNTTSVVLNGHALSLSPARGSSATYGGLIVDGSASGQVVVSGQGTVVLSGSNTYSGGTTLQSGTLELGATGAVGAGAITFGGASATLRIDAVPTNGTTFANTLAAIAVGDTIDLSGLAYASGATAVVSQSSLVVSSGGLNEAFTLSGAGTTLFQASSDGGIGTLVTAVAAPTITGATASHPTSSETPVTPFSTVTIGDTNANAMETLTIAVGGAGGTLTGAGALTNGVYTLTGTATAVTTALDVVSFTPTPGQPNKMSTTTFTLSDTSSAYTTATINGVVTVVDTDPDVAPVITSGASATVVEGTSVTTPVYTATATDAAGSAVTYSLAGTDAGLLAIDASSGVVTLKNVADYQTKPSYSFSVVASDGTLSSTQAVALAVSDVAPTITSGASATVVEGTPVTTPVYTATATDVVGSAVTYSLAGTDAGLLAIDASSGVVTLKNVADYQTKPSYSFSVVASDGTLSSTQAVALAVSDVAPTITSSATATVVEGTSITTPVYTATATDVAGSAVTYSLAGTDAGLLAIDASSGVVTLKNMADYQTKPSYSFSVVASDGTLSSTQAVALAVSDVAPTITSGASATVVEGTSITTPVYTATATDVVGSAVTYSLAGTDAGLLAIDASSGVVTLKNVADYQTKPSYSFSVVASDGTLSSTQAVALAVSDVAPTITSGASATVVEGTSITTPVYTATATDVVGSAVTYSLAGTDAGLLAIDASSGVVTLKNVADYQTKPSYSFSVVASDGTLSSTQAVALAVSDVAPTITSSATATVVEGTSITTPVYTATATDVAGSAVTYSLAGTDAGLLAIDASSGVVTLKNVADYQTKPSYSFSVVASDGTLSSTQAVALAVSDVAPVVTASASTPTVQATSSSGAVETFAASATDAVDGTGDALVYTEQLAGGATKTVQSGDTFAIGTHTIVASATDSQGLTGQSAPFSFTVTPLPAETQGVAEDGYIAGATVFADANHNGVLDAGEAFATTDAKGDFALVGGSGPLVLTGGTDITTGIAQTGTLQAPAGSGIVSPLTTIVQIVATTQGISAAAANASVVASLGLPLGTNLATLDAQTGATAGNATATAVFAAQTQVANAFDLIMAAGGSLTSSAATTAIATAFTNSASVLTSATALSTLALQAGVGAAAASSVGKIGSAANALIATAASSGSSAHSIVTTIAAAATVAQGAAATSLAQAVADPSTLAATTAAYTGNAFVQATTQAGGTLSAPSITLLGSGGSVSELQVALSGTVDLADVSGTVQLYENGTAVGAPVAVSAQGTFAAGLTLPGDGTYAVTATKSNGAGALGTSNALTFTLDSTPNQSLFGTLTHDVTSKGGNIYALYETILGRAPDATGFENDVAAVQAGASLSDIAQGMLASPEYASDYGASVQSNNGFVTQLYGDGLHRQPDAGGLQTWTTALGSGQLTRAQVALDIATSSESRGDLASTFQAGVFAPSATDASIARLYYGLLDRAPDAGGLRNAEQAVAAGATLTQIATGMLGSPEYQTTAVGQGNLSYVEGLYHTALGRVGELGAVQNYETALDTGAVTRAGVANAFLESTEFQNDEAGQSNATYVNAVYQAALGRQADAGGLQTWDNALASGMSRATVAQNIVGSAEFAANVTGSGQAMFVNALYEGALGRPAEAGGLATWQSQLATGASAASVALGIAESPEATAHLAPAIEAGFHVA